MTPNEMRSRFKVNSKHFSNHFIHNIPFIASSDILVGMTKCHCCQLFVRKKIWKDFLTTDFVEILNQTNKDTMECCELHSHLLIFSFLFGNYQATVLPNFVID